MMGQMDHLIYQLDEMIHLSPMWMCWKDKKLAFEQNDLNVMVGQLGHISNLYYIPSLLNSGLSKVPGSLAASDY